MAVSAAVFCGVGGCVPDSVVTNADLARRYDTSDEWIRSRTGIRQRHVVRAGEATSDIAVRAGAAALRSAGIHAVDAVVLATSTPDHPCPASAPTVARKLGLHEAAAFDLNAVCAGFVYALAAATGLIATGMARTALVIGADAFSTILDPADRATAAVFGDGAGAVVLRAGGAGEPGAVLACDLGSDGDLAELIAVRAGGSRHPLVMGAPVSGGHFFAMHGKAVYRHAVRRMSASARAVLGRVGWRPPDVDCFVGHQANQRILAAVGAEVGIAPERVFTNIERVGNTAAASIPLALADAAAAGALRPGRRVLLTAFGGGAAWGSAALTWPEL
ncbi:beta-ketoacyl-ACP synthase III [Actinokineospora sp. UTMC 2448]|uniref:beta-ketoacyl-ACP synthase III n=1 Tax=Actinokineospora sp. UTMC 2448 TaxID=2268449 RepID=UPI00216429B7|nr:beta-ketoacyl-ACP synthase III [Actinokineospora sp. UTMC 2448]